MVRLLRNWPKNEKRLTLELFGTSYDEFRLIFPQKQPISRFNELINDSKNKLQSALSAVAFESSNGYRYKPGIEATAAYLFFINQSHFLFNGNKRASLYGTFGYLLLHGHFLETKWEEVYKMAEKIAEIGFQPSSLQNVIQSAHTWILKHPETI